jgi:hypothetical protein
MSVGAWWTSSGGWCKGVGRSTEALARSDAGGSGERTEHGLHRAIERDLPSTAAVLAWRSRGAARCHARLHAGMYLVGTVYNFCTYQASLSTVRSGPRTPAMAAGLARHLWSVTEMLQYRVPPPRWRPPKRRGRRSKALQQLIDRRAA